MVSSYSTRGNQRPFLLIAEDDPDDQYLIWNAITAACKLLFQAHFVRNGDELMNYLRQETQSSIIPNLLLLDLNMPGKDGRTALRELKADPRLAEIPIVVLTTSQNPEDIQYCQQFDIAGYYVKPGSITELRDIIGRLCAEYLV